MSQVSSSRPKTTKSGLTVYCVPFCRQVCICVRGFVWEKSIPFNALFGCQLRMCSNCTLGAIPLTLNHYCMSVPIKNSSAPDESSGARGSAYPTQEGFWRRFDSIITPTLKQQDIYSVGFFRGGIFFAIFQHKYCNTHIKISLILYSYWLLCNILGSSPGYLCPLAECR